MVMTEKLEQAVQTLRSLPLDKQDKLAPAIQQMADLAYDVESNEQHSIYNAILGKETIVW